MPVATGDGNLNLVEAILDFAPYPPKIARRTDTIGNIIRDSATGAIFGGGSTLYTSGAFWAFVDTNSPKDTRP
jgi:hypothetical protein